MSKDEINRLLAEKVMGWERGPYGVYMVPDSFGRVPTSYAFDETQLEDDEIMWNPHDNIAQAMMIADKVIAMGYALNLSYDRARSWSCVFEDGSVMHETKGAYSASAAICDVALKVVEND